MKSTLKVLKPVEIFCILSTFYVKQAQTIKMNEQIISGSQAALGQFPWLVILKRNADQSLWCGGSIISENWVLVAAHCTLNVPELFLIFGSINKEHYENGIHMTVSKFFMHPQYNNANLNNDIALIKLPSPLSYTHNIQAIALVTEAEAKAANDFVGAEAIIAGFGQVNNDRGVYSEVLLWAQVEVISNSRCLALHNDPALIVTTVMCAIGFNNSYMSSCYGDSGGPLIWKNKANKFVQIGITSFITKVNVCTEKYPTGYARVSSYLDFIRKITGLHFE